MSLRRGEGVEFNGAARQGLPEADESVIVALAVPRQDIGHVFHRDDHPYYSIPLAADLLDRIFPDLGYDVAETGRLNGEALHAILRHHLEEDPLTLEVGVLRVTDTLDVEQERSRIPYERGGRGINTVSSQAVKAVSFYSGEDNTVLVEIEITNAAGVHQVDDLPKATVGGSGLGNRLRIVALDARRTTTGSSNGLSCKPPLP